jgi:hypothetical protein
MYPAPYSLQVLTFAITAGVLALARDELLSMLA